MANKTPEVGLMNNDGDAHLLTRTEKTMVLQNPVWDDMRTSLNSAFVPATANPGFTQFKDNGSGSTGVFLYWFDKTNEEQVYFNVQFPHSQMLNTAISPHVHWVPKTNGGAGAKVCWGFEYTWVEIGGTFGDTSIIYADTHVPADTSLVAGKHYLTPFADLEGHTASVSNVMVCRLFRDAGGTGGTDDYDDDAGALYFDIHFQADTMGSRTELSK